MLVGNEIQYHLKKEIRGFYSPLMSVEIFYLMRLVSYSNSSFCKGRVHGYRVDKAKGIQMKSGIGGGFFCLFGQLKQVVFVYGLLWCAAATNDQEKG
jgi:hypothetical protein